MTPRLLRLLLVMFFFAGIATTIVYVLIAFGMPVTGYTIYWIYWLVVGFGTAETLALTEEQKESDQDPRSLSRNTWGWFAITGKGRGAAAWRIRRLALLSFMAWLSLHLLTGGAF